MYIFVQRPDVNRSSLSLQNCFVITDSMILITIDLSDNLRSFARNMAKLIIAYKITLILGVGRCCTHMEHAPTEIVFLQLKKKCRPNLTEKFRGEGFM